MQSDTDFVSALVQYMSDNPQASMMDIKLKFYNVPTEKILYTINEMLIS